jgi:hypothetical protein
MCAHRGGASADGNGVLPLTDEWMALVFGDIAIGDVPKVSEAK